MKKLMKSFLAVALCATTTLASGVVPTLANTITSTSEATLANMTMDQLVAYLRDVEGIECFNVPENTPVPQTQVEFAEFVATYTDCPPVTSNNNNTAFNEVSKLMLTNATVAALFDRPYKDHGYMTNYLSYVAENLGTYYCNTLGMYLYTGTATGVNKVQVTNRVVQIPTGTTMSVPASTALEMRYLSGDGSSITSLQTSNLKHFTLSSVIYNLASNNIVGHFYPQIVNDRLYITFKDSGMYTLYAQVDPLDTTTVNGQSFYKSEQLSKMLQYSVFLVVSNEGLPFSWYLPTGNDYNYIGTVVSPVVGTVAIPSTGIMHTVQAGDTLYSLAKKYYGSDLFVNKVYNANSHRISEQTALIVGQQIYLPR